jgi:hypothetical protein
MGSAATNALFRESSHPDRAWRPMFTIINLYFDRMFGHRWRASRRGRPAWQRLRVPGAAAWIGNRAAVCFTTQNLGGHVDHDLAPTGATSQERAKKMIARLTSFRSMTRGQPQKQLRLDCCDEIRSRFPGGPRTASAIGGFSARRQLDAPVTAKEGVPWKDALRL